MRNVDGDVDIDLEDKIQTARPSLNLRINRRPTKREGGVPRPFLNRLRCRIGLPLLAESVELESSSEDAIAGIF